MIAHPTVYALEQTIVHALMDGRIKIAVHFIVQLLKIVHILKEIVLVQINAIVLNNGVEMIVTHLFVNL
jgi:hypothetical protein